MKGTALPKTASRTGRDHNLKIEGLKNKIGFWDGGFQLIFKGW